MTDTIRANQDNVEEPILADNADWYPESPDANNLNLNIFSNDPTEEQKTEQINYEPDPTEILQPAELIPANGGLGNNLERSRELKNGVSMEIQVFSKEHLKTAKGAPYKSISVILPLYSIVPKQILIFKEDLFGELKKFKNGRTYIITGYCIIKKSKDILWTDQSKIIDKADVKKIEIKRAEIGIPKFKDPQALCYLPCPEKGCLGAVKQTICFRCKKTSLTKEYQYAFEITIEDLSENVNAAQAVRRATIRGENAAKIMGMDAKEFHELTEKTKDEAIQKVLEVLRNEYSLVLSEIKSNIRVRSIETIV